MLFRSEDGMRVRCSYAPYLKHVKAYYEELIPRLTPLQITEGGPVLMIQIENEYGYFGDDTAYLESLRDMMVELGVTVPFVTSDGPWGDALTCGKVDGVLCTGNFGSKSEEQFEVLRKVEEGPLMCMEFWVGWFDHWGVEKHQTTEIEGSARDLDAILDKGHVNIYMFHGGTNFGFMNGSNYYDELTPDVTSYDYDALLSEDGQVTQKYLAFKEVISKYIEEAPVEYVSPIKRAAYGKIEVAESVSLKETLGTISETTTSLYPVSMERVGQSYGYIMYSSTLMKEQDRKSVV